MAFHPRRLANVLKHLTQDSGAMNLFVASLTCSFLLCLIASGIGIGNFPYAGKQVGFLWAPNWTVVYMVLFPTYLLIFSQIITVGAASLGQFASRGTVLQVNSDNTIES